MVLLPKGQRKTTTLIVPNKGAKDRKINPRADVAKLAGRLKIGDTVRFGYSSLAGRMTVTKLSITRFAGRPDAEPKPFIFVSSRKLRTTKQSCLAVTARRDTTSWTFLADLPEEKDSKGEVGADAAESGAARALAEKAGRFRPGDLVSLEYKTVDYRFILTDIRARRMSGRGRLVRLGKRNIEGTVHDMALIATAGLPLSAVVPTVKGDDGRPAGDPKVTGAMKDLKLKQPVEFKYRREGGIIWLDEIAPAGEPVGAKSDK